VTPRHATLFHGSAGPTAGSAAGRHVATGRLHPRADDRHAVRRFPARDAKVFVDTLHGVAIADRYRWLERQDDPAVLAWIDEQRRYAEQVLGPERRERGEIRERLRALMDVPSISAPVRRGVGVLHASAHRRGGCIYLSAALVAVGIARLSRRRVCATHRAARHPSGRYDERRNRGSLGGWPAPAVLGARRGPDEITVRVRDVVTGRVLDFTRGLDAHFARRTIDGEIWMRTDHRAPRCRLIAATSRIRRRRAGAR